MAYKREYVFYEDLEEKLENFERDGYTVVAVYKYDGWLKPAGDQSPRLCDIKRGFEVLLKK